MSILFVGGGNMAAALIGGLVSHGQALSDIAVVEVNEATAAQLSARWGIRVYAAVPADLGGASTVVLAVKPQQMTELLGHFPSLPATALLVSIVAGWTTSRLSTGLKGHANLVRAMPNTPALIQAGVTGLFALPGVSEEDRARVQAMMHAVGSVHWLTRESQMDAVTALSGSGPAYVFYLMEILQQAALDLDLPADMARALVLEMVRGAALLACSEKDTPAQLRRRVTSPGGTTEAALRVLEEGAWARVLEQAVQAAARRSRELEGVV
ncbi:pyrroline-5-carboxylate reductase [Ferrovum sp.]|uniref:pyrroline-5-carboxylate reductase n=1 Tax=Ferrovum sp. TaxID=2609467 RepID=UPI002626B5CF|nr:pyrroline-5-carboxylate reductase [Ferrovum sp.]